MHRAYFTQSFFFFSSQQSQFQVPAMEPFVGTGADPGFNAQEHTNKALTTGPFDNTCEEDEVSPEVEAWVVAGLKCLQP
jgi:hypothetical protein